MTKQQRDRLRALSDLEHSEARVYAEWVRTRRNTLLYLTYCVVGAGVFWGAMLWVSVVLLMCAFAYLSVTTYSVVQFRRATGVWPWNPIRRIR